MVRKLAKSSRRLAAALAVPLGVILIALLVCATSVWTSEVTITRLAKASEVARLPFAEPGDQTSSARFQGKILIPPLAGTTVHIVPDDCLNEVQLGGISFPLSTWGDSVCDWGKGIEVDLQPYLEQKGFFRVASFTLGVQNQGGRFGLRIGATQDSVLLSWPVLAAFAALLLALWAGLKRAGFCTAAAALILFGLTLRWGYFSITRFEDRAHDVDAHVAYLTHIAEHWSLPRIDAGWAFFQPPLYYLLVAPIVSFAGHNEATFILLQLFSFCCSAVVLVAGASIARSAAPERVLMLLTVFLLATWPALIIHSVRVSNDPLLHAISAVAMALLLKWWLSREARDLYCASLLAGAAVVTKANGLAICGAVLGLLMLAAWRDGGGRVRIPSRQTIKNLGAVMLLFIWGPIISLGRGVAAQSENPQVHWLVGQAFNWMNKDLLVSNTPFNYFYLDIAAFLGKPFMNPWTDESGRQFFWNYLLKSSLFGEFEFSFPGAETVALLIAACALIVFIFPLADVLLARLSDLRNRSPYLILLGAHLILLLAFRIKTPVSGNADFRYVAAAIIPFLLLYAESLARTGRQGFRVLTAVGMGAGFALGVLSFAFFSLLFLHA